eukprot:5067180-Pleurochrysis_carterae.AAC.1
MGWAYDIFEETMVATSKYGAYLMEPTLNIFEAIANEQPAFKNFFEKEMREEKARARTDLSYSKPCALRLPLFLPVLLRFCRPMARSATQNTTTRLRRRRHQKTRATSRPLQRPPSYWR